MTPKPSFLSVLSVSLLGAVSLPRPVAAEPPALEEARVTISYEELKSLLKAADQAAAVKIPPKPPVEAVLSSARYRLDLAGEHPALTADFEARTFSDAWHTLPLLGGDARLLDADTGEAGDAQVVWRDAGYSLLAGGQGTFSAKLSLTVPSPHLWPRDAGFRLAPVAATLGELRVTGLPAGKTIQVEGLEAIAGPGGEWIFPLPAAGADWRLRIEETMEVPPAPQPSAWSLHSQIAIRYADGRLRHTARVQARAESGSGLSLALALPAKAAAVSVEGEDLERWRLEPREADLRLVRIDWKTRDLLDRTVTVSWETPQSPLADSWEIAPPRAVNPELVAAPADDSRSLIALAEVDGLELTHPSLRGGTEASRLPDWLRKQLGAEDESLTAEIAGDEPLTLGAAWLPRVETAQATVSLATFETRLVADGDMLVMAEYTIRHGAPTEWLLQLPQADEILTCEVNGQPTKPIRRADDQIEFRLAAPVAPDGAEEVSGTKVRLCYSLKTEAVDPVSGRIALELPLTSLFIHRLEWSVALPSGYEPSAVEGNVQLSPGGSDDAAESGNRILLEKELCRGERPAVEIYYQRRDLTSDS